MKRVGGVISRLAIASIGGATFTLCLVGLFNWARTEHFYFDRNWVEVATASAFTLAFCLLSSGLVLAIMAIGRRYRPLKARSAIMLGALSFCLPLGVLIDPKMGLTALPAGILAGYILWLPPGERIGRKLSAFLIACCVIWLSLLVLPVVGAFREKFPTSHPADPLLGTSVMSGILLDSELWLIDATGKAASLRLPDLKPTVRARSGVAALTTDGEAVIALQAPPMNWRMPKQPAGRFRVATFADHRWRYSPWRDYAEGQRPLAMLTSTAGTIVLGPERLYILSGTGKPLRSQKLSQAIDNRGQFVAEAVGANSIYVGINRGEWGGGLLRITLDTGRVALVDRHDDRQLCSGPLNSNCDPVTGLVADDRHAGCLFASIGLSHMMSHGRVLRICDDKIAVVFERPILPLGERIERIISRRARSFPPQTEAVFSLLPAERGFRAVTRRGIYRWRDGDIRRYDFPELHRKHGLAISTSLRGLAVVTTIANGSMSMSGYTPMLFADASREGTGR